MSSLGLTQEELRAVEQTRQRLSQLSSSINSLKNDVFVSHPLPNLDSLQASADILNHNVRAILDTLAQNNDLFSRVAVHPSTNFPGRTQESILLQLLRKKPEPDVEASMDEGRMMLANLPTPNNAMHGTTMNQEKAKEKAFEDVWGATRDTCGVRIADYVMNEEGDYFTAEEHEIGTEKVRTGLRRTFDDEYEDDDDDENEEEGDDVMVIDRPPPPPAPAISTQEVDGSTIETIMRLATRGQFAG
ncbi:hypothetical protein HD806DRAFT_493438 [Xylariaceae sp. AK1471]|nr:hypothetical protein HD806DRAFT_493438 [Xylariaceae sp. AK1471]